MSRWYSFRAAGSALVVEFKNLRPPVTVFWTRVIGVRVGCWFIGAMRGHVPTMDKEFTP